MTELTNRAAPIYADHMPITILEKSHGVYLLETTFSDYHLNAAGSVHGGMLSAFLDCGLAGGASWADGDGTGSYGITMTMTVNFVSGAGPGTLKCAARVQGGGRTTRFVEAVLFTDNEKAPIATATGAVRVIPLP